MLTNIWVGNTQLAVDIVGELEPYFESAYRVRWTDDKLSAPSPFRYDKSPSFFVNLIHLDGKEVAGTWIDSGASEGDEFRSGKLEKLLSFLRNETVEETCIYLREKYGVQAYDKLSLNLDFKVKTQFQPLEVKSTEYAIEYLESRHIRPEVTYDSMVGLIDNKAVFHWMNPQGEVIAIKYRLTDAKTFFYEKGGKRLNEQLYNIQRCYQKNFTSLWLTEAEIDALSVESTVDRFVGIALGGASFSDKQRDLVIRAGVPNVVIATDNDKQGEQVARVIEKKLKGFVKLYRTKLLDCKDLNEFVGKFGKLPKLVELNGVSFNFKPL